MNSSEYANLDRQDYVFLHATWPYHKETITYSFRSSSFNEFDWRDLYIAGSPSDTVREAFRDAIATWERVCGVTFAEIEDSRNADVRIGMNNSRDHDYSLGVTWTDSRGGTILSQAVAVQTGFNQRYLDWTYEDLYDMALHEMGHVLGIGHSDTNGVVMSGPPGSEYSNQLGLDTLTSDDIEAAQTLWGLPDGTEGTLGTISDDVIGGTDSGDVIMALAGNDVILGFGGYDTLYGGSGDDTLYGQGGNDQLFGGDGNDRLCGMEDNDELMGGPGNDVLLGGAGSDYLDGGAGNDRMFAADGNDTVIGGAGNDLVSGGAGNDKLYGMEGSDYLHGGAGNDTLYGGEGARNTMAGGSGNDYLYATGNFTMFGQEGSDTFVHVKGDGWIMDFNPDEDRIVLQGTNIVIPDSYRQAGPHAHLTLEVKHDREFHDYDLYIADTRLSELEEFGLI